MNTKTIRYVLYVFIVIICAVSIIIGVYAQFFREDDDYAYSNDIEAGGNSNIVTTQDVNKNFLDLFNNQLNSKYEGQLTKLDINKDIVYTFYSNIESSDGKYTIDVNIPLINISSDVVSEYNNISQKVFVDKLNAVMNNSNVYTIYNLDYTAYVNNNILSVAIMATIKEGNDPQRIIVQTYNYDLVNNKNVEIEDILAKRQIDKTVVQNKVNNTIKKASEDATKMAESGFQVYQRNTNDDMYKIENINNFIQGPNGELYIVFAYGNNNITSEMDVVQI